MTTTNFLSNSAMVLKVTEAKQSGKFFTVIFVKRTTGEVRKMVCRGGVKSNGGKLPYNPNDKALVTVWDVKARNFRHINANSIALVKFQGKIFRPFYVEQTALDFVHDYLKIK